jgi:hypothetical protein
MKEITPIQNFVCAVVAMLVVVPMAAVWIGLVWGAIWFFGPLLEFCNSAGRAVF